MEQLETDEVVRGWRRDLRNVGGYTGTRKSETVSLGLLGLAQGSHSVLSKVRTSLKTDRSLGTKEEDQMG